MDQKNIITYHVLVLSRSANDIEALRKALEQARDGPFAVVSAPTLADALTQIATAQVDAILCDLQLPDSAGLATFDTLYRAASDTPILILVSEDEEPTGIDAVQRGAQGFLSKGHFSNSLVPQALRNIIHRKAIESALYIERERGREILEAIGEAVVSTDLNHNVIYMNVVAERMTGWARDSAQGRPFAQVAHVIDDRRRPAWHRFLTAIREDKRIYGVSGMRLLHLDGRETPVDVSIATVHDRSGKMSGAVAVLHDTREAEAANFAKMAYLAQHDFLTGLPNRMLLNDRIGHEIALAKRHGTLLAVLFLDLDNFKHINDSLGHSIGDLLLQKVADVLKTHTRGSDTVSRQGGDEFIIVSAHDKNIESIAVTAEKLLAELERPQTIAGHALHIGGSMGVSVYPQDGADAETLVKHADAALYHAKNNGRHTYQFFDQKMNERAVERQIIEANLRHALDHDELMLHYQPRINLQTGAITGAEALLRWRHPQRGMMLPDQFIDIAEDSGLIGLIGKWVLGNVCRQARAWQDAGLGIGTIAMNISASEFRGDGFLAGVRAALEDSRFSAANLEFELTESVLMRDAESSNTTLTELKKLGISLVVDDFGTGYSSLSYLSQFPIDILKIDQSFVRNVAPGSGNAKIISAVIGMGHSLNLRVVAEGIETPDQCAFLRAQDCDEGQGFFLGAPQPAPQFSMLLAAAPA